MLKRRASRDWGWPPFPKKRPGLSFPGTLWLFRNSLRHFLAGSGIEVGALHAPLDLAGLPIDSIRYVDRCSQAELRKQYPELARYALAPVDIIDDGERLDRIAAGSLDFIIANHFIEHTRDPMGTIYRWLAKLRQGGIIFLTVPDKHYTFDVDRELTPLQHLRDDFLATPSARLASDRQHFVEWAIYVDKKPAAEVEAHVKALISADYSIHFHTFTLHSFLGMLDCLRRESDASFHLKACADVIEGSHEFCIVLARTP
jgi:SAM-dependent methyltransferase